jgi:hypothetical protein
VTTLEGVPPSPSRRLLRGHHTASPTSPLAHPFAGTGNHAADNGGDGYNLTQPASAAPFTQSLYAVPASPEMMGAAESQGSSPQASRPTSTNALRCGSSASVFSGLVTIHVLDETRKVKRDFYCPRQLLAREMCYFAVYLADASAA